MTAPAPCPQSPQGGAAVGKKHRFLAWGCLWSVICAGLGFAACWLPWGEPDRLHGQGFPVPIVMWDKPPGSDHFIDYVGFAGVILNPVCFLVAGWLLAGTVYAAWWVLRRFLRLAKA